MAEGLLDFIINEHQGGEVSITQQMQDNKEVLANSNEFMSENSGVGKV